MSLPQDTQRVSVVESYPTFVAVQAHPQPGWERSGVRLGHVAVAATVGIQSSVALAVTLALTVAMSVREQDFAHAHGQEAEGRGVLAVLCPTVMAAVCITARE